MQRSHTPEAGTILLIENDRHIRLILAEMLSSTGLHVDERSDGECLFLPELAREIPAVIVTDVDLGEKCRDGLEVARQARRHWPDVGVVFITGQPSRLNEQRQSDRDRFVAKPFRATQLIEAVVSLLEG